MKVLFLTNIPSPYRVLFFNLLGAKCDLTVLYQKTSSSERNGAWIAESKNTYKSIFLNGKSTGVDNAFCPSVIKYLSSDYDAIIICGNASPTEILAIEWCKLKRIPFCLEGDGAFAKSGNYLKQLFKRHLIRSGQLFFSTCAEHDKYYKKYGANTSRIVRYHFSSLLQSDIIDEIISADEKKDLRKKLGMHEDKIIITVGQFIYRKGFDVLLKSAMKLPKNLGIYIIGDTPTEEYLSFVNNNKLTNVHFVGFKSKLELKEFYKAADVFVLPTREDIWGLVVNEAMAYGLPVITTKRCNAGLELIINGENGYLISVDNHIELSDKVMITLQNSDDMGRNALKTIRKYTIETMVDDHIRILKKYIKLQNQH